MIALDILRLLLAIAIAFVVGKLVSKLKLPAILGWLITGMVFGPHALNLIGDEILNAGWYDVMEIRDMREEASNGYLWYLTNDGYWCAQVSGVVYYPKQEQPPEPDDKADWELVYNTAKKHVELQ